MNVKNNNIIVKNKNASRNYHLSDKYQAGLVLEGWEVKGLRNGKVDVKDSYVTLRNNEAWIIGLKIDAPASLKNENKKTDDVYTNLKRVFIKHLDKI